MDMKFGTWNVTSMYRAGSLRSLIVLNVHAPTEDKIYDMKDRFYEGLK
jgi:hypothetical protein